MLSYQHIYHAGNGADLQKHLWLITVLKYLLRKDKPLCWIDTHAGRGLYDLTAPEAQKIGEYKKALLPVYEALKDQSELPPPLSSYIDVLKSYLLQNQYPGSALLAAKILRKDDAMFAFDMHKGEYPHLANALTPYRNIHTHQADGLDSLLAKIPPIQKRGGVLIDPSYEIKTDYTLVVETMTKALKKWSTGVYMIWYPLLAAGNHETLLKGCKALDSNVVIDEWLWRDPNAEGKGLYGSGMIIFNAPYTCAETMADIKSRVLSHIHART
jgi:23S rRNA (adenine2030-N6)-methyltransferase